MASRLTCQIGGCVVADPFKAFLFVKRGLVIAVSFSVRFDQAKYRIRGLLCLGTATAAGTLGSIAAAAARVPALTTLATAATARNRRRVGSRGGNIMGWSIADVFVGGVLCTLSALAIGFRLLSGRG
jgi:hypothetical protein